MLVLFQAPQNEITAHLGPSAPNVISTLMLLDSVGDQPPALLPDFLQPGSCNLLNWVKTVAEQPDFAIGIENLLQINFSQPVVSLCPAG